MMKKDCRHVRAGENPEACGCSYYAGLRLGGKMRWIRLGPDLGPARAEYKRLVREAKKDRGQQLVRTRNLTSCEQVVRAFLAEETDPATGLSAQTRNAFKVRTGAFLAYFGEQTPFAHVATDDIVEWRRALRTQLSKNYEREVLACARRLCEWAAANEYVESSPWPTSWPRMPRRAPKRKRPRHHPVDRMRDTATQVRQPYGDACELMLLTGLRAGEVLALIPEDIVWEKGEPVAIEVQANFDLVERRRVERVKTDDSYRTVELSPRAAEILTGQLADCDDGVRLWPYVHHTVNKWWQRAQADSGLEPALGLHSLRHAHRTMCEMAGMDDRLIAYRLGHGDRTEWSRSAYGTGTQQARAAELAKLDG